jgi:hypothetical protein
LTAREPRVQERELGRRGKTGDDAPGEKCGNAKLETRNTKSGKPIRKKTSMKMEPRKN